ncbi:hypothetical protein RL72_00916 [Microbacterium azadirachtae]|uniref:Uncharacterized protein n=1 Tax=Microbacterium azadirachtae TaxID=582680 RepID=A0A0F0L1L9_9MICO|nr:hypothetical protein RL72_00916 [Microbacterium azadirachtae]
MGGWDHHHQRGLCDKRGSLDEEFEVAHDSTSIACHAIRPLAGRNRLLTNDGLWGLTKMSAPASAIVAASAWPRSDATKYAWRSSQTVTKL